MHDQLTHRGTSGTPVQTAPALPALQDHPRSVPAATQSAPIREWAGRDAVALRKALRMTEAKFARAVGVSARTVANWHTYPAMVPRNDAQDRLDELFTGASPAVLERFGRFGGHQPAPGQPDSHSPGDLERTLSNWAVSEWLGARQLARSPGPRDSAAGRVVSMGSHLRYRADFRALASGQVAEVRAALGLTLAEFAALLKDTVGLNVMPETVGRWETESAPPGDVVLFAQAYLATMTRNGALMDSGAPSWRTL